MYNEFVSEDIRSDSNIIVPVICDDMFEYKASEEDLPLSIKEVICKKYIKQINNETEREHIYKAIQSNYYYGVSLLEQKKNTDLSNAIYRLFEEAVNEGYIRLKPCVKNFLNKGNFPLVITTFGFPLIEKIETLNYSEKISEWFNPNDRNDLPMNIGNGNKVVYHIFGGRNSFAWVYNEQTLLEFMHALHSVDYGAKNLSNYLCDNNPQISKLLVLGSTLPDWLFRFLIYPMFNDKEKLKGGYWLSLDNIEEGLEFFLDRNNYTGQTNLQNDKRDKLKDILEDVWPLQINDDNKLIANEPLNIFISYKREKEGNEVKKKLDRAITLLKKQGNVWLDIEEVADGGNKYWENIKNAVRNCDVFIPLITSAYLEEYRDSPDLDKFSDEYGINNNDSEDVKALKPVLREAYYAISLKKRPCPIVIVDSGNKDNNSNLDGGIVERIANSKNDSRNLPLSIFSQRTILQFDDEHPELFRLPVINK